MKKVYLLIITICLFLSTVTTGSVFSESSSKGVIYFNLVKQNEYNPNVIVSYDYDQDGMLSTEPKSTIIPTIDGKPLSAPLGDIGITSDGTLWGITYAFGPDQTTDLYIINPNDGSSTLEFSLVANAYDAFNALSGFGENLIFGSTRGKNYLYDSEAKNLTSLPSSPANNSGDFLNFDNNRVLAATYSGIFLMDMNAGSNKIIGKMYFEGLEFLSYGLTNVSGKILAVNSSTGLALISESSIAELNETENTPINFLSTGRNIPQNSGFSEYQVWGIAGAEEAKEILKKGADVNVDYKDETGNTISISELFSGNVGETYTTEQKTISGYTFKEVVGNPTGTFTEEEQTVTYIYTKDPVEAGHVTAKYVDETGNEISSNAVLTGFVGESYTTEKKTISGYTFKEVAGSPTGIFTEE